MVERRFRATSSRIGIMGTDRNKLKRHAAKVKARADKGKKNEPKAKKAAAPTAAAPSAASPSRISASEFEWHVTLAAKGMAERDRFPMPKSVTTPEAFYEIMAGAALEATGLRALIERATRAERELDLIRAALRQSEVKAETARHRIGTADDATPDSQVAPQAAVIRPAGPLPSAPSTGETKPRAAEHRASDHQATDHRTTEGEARRRIPGLAAAYRTLGALVAAAHRAWSWNKAAWSGAWSWSMRVVLRRPERVTCSQCGARHPVIYGGDPCLICDTTLPPASAAGGASRGPRLSVL